MKYEFIDENTVKLEAKLAWSAVRPPFGSRINVDKTTYISNFSAENPEYEVISVTGPDKIYNFRSEDQAEGTWILTVSKKQKPVVKPAVKPKTASKKTSKKKTKKAGF